MVNFYDNFVEINEFKFHWKPWGATHKFIHNISME